MRTFTLILLSLAISACDYKTMKPETNPIEGQTGPGGLIEPATFVTVSNSIFKRSCTGCHNSSNSKGDVDLSSYQAILDREPPILVAGKPNESDIYITVRNGDMPLGGSALSDIEKAYIEKWILSGAPEK